MVRWCAGLLLLGLAQAVLVSNDLGKPQDLSAASGVPVCANRSSFCNVLLDVPAACAGQSSNCPVLFCLHGFGGTNLQYVQQCGQEVHTSAFIGVYPRGDPLAKTADGKPSGFGWNDGMSVNAATSVLRCKYDNFTCSLDPNDTTYFEAMVRALRSTGAAGNLYAFGQSNGADWAQRLAVNAGPSLPFAGIAPQSGQLNSKPPRSAAGPFNFNQPAEGRPRVAQLAIHGTADTSIPYAGGQKFHSPYFVLFSEPDSDKTWAEHNGCSEQLTTKNVSAEFRNGSGRSTGVSTHHVYLGCPPVAPVEWYQTHGAGHVGTSTLDGAPVVRVALDFFARVEKAKGMGRA